MTSKTQFEQPYKLTATHDVHLIVHIESDCILEVRFYDPKEIVDDDTPCDGYQASYIRIDGDYLTGEFKANCRFINQVHQGLAVQDLDNLSTATTHYLETYFPQHCERLNLMMAIPGDYGISLIRYSSANDGGLHHGMRLNEPAGVIMFFNTSTGLLIAYTEPIK